jgi:hypothetical protein
MRAAISKLLRRPQVLFDAMTEGSRFWVVAALSDYPGERLALVTDASLYGLAVVREPLTVATCRHSCLMELHAL